MVHIRPAAPEDSDAIACVHVAGWRWAYRGIFPDAVLDTQDLGRRQAQWRRILADPLPLVFVADRGGDIIGFCGARHGADPQPEAR